MKKQRSWRVRLLVEELEPRVVLSSSGAGDAIAHTTAVQSTNWSGYAAETNLGTPQNNAVSAVSGNWVVPSVTGTSTAYSSFWVGIDGYSSNTVEQIGTDSDLSGSTPVYYAWYEMYPAWSVNITLDNSGNNFVVNPGDSIAASVNYTGSNNFQLQITDTTSAHTFSITQTSSNAHRSSAEWIAEAPSSIGGILPLANFKTVNFSNASATFNGVTGAIDNSSWQNAAITMASKKGVLEASPGALTDSSTTPATSSFAVKDVTPAGGTGGHGHDRQRNGLNDLLLGSSVPSRPATASGVQFSSEMYRPLAASNPSIPTWQMMSAPVKTPSFLQSSGSSLVDMAPDEEANADMVEVPFTPPAGPAAPAARPMPNREVPAPAMPPNQSNHDESGPVFFPLETAVIDAALQNRASSSGNLLQAFAGLLGAFSAFNLWSEGSLKKTATEEREKLERQKRLAQ